MVCRVQWARTLADVDPEAWDALSGPDNPFVEHAFLQTLEDAGCVGTEETGWVPNHLLVYDGSLLVGAAPFYIKYDSFGEYIFDWGWAWAAERAGIPYYPKLVCAVPFTPATGPRLLVHPSADRDAVTAALAQAMRDVAEATEASSIHCLFTLEAEQDVLAQHGFAARASHQYHWLRAPQWHSFDDYLAAMRAQNRKQVRRERRRAREHGLSLSLRRGTELAPHHWQALWRFYRATTSAKGAIPYLTPKFFELLPERLSHRAVVALAEDGDQPLAAALLFAKGKHLYGRYWGARAALEGVHFELCYYLPIEWALEHGIERFEAGAQGPHKIKRGFLPAPCYSAHWIAHPGLARAVEEFLPREAAHVRADIQALARHTPFRRDEP